jgi:hypothetical protein
MLQENASLEILIVRGWSNEIRAEEYVALITALLHNNATLESVKFQRHGSLWLTGDDDDDDDE